MPDGYPYYDAQDAQDAQDASLCVEYGFDDCEALADWEDIIGED